MFVFVFQLSLKRQPKSKSKVHMAVVLATIRASKRGRRATAKKPRNPS
jgi:hypothetical protein